MGQITRAANQNSQPKPAARFRNQLATMIPEIAKALPAHLDAERFGRIIMTTVQQTPKLLQCDPQSVFAAVLTCAQLGLEPGPLGHAWILPYYDKRNRQHQAQFIPGYRGMIDLARRSGAITSIYAHEVREHDEFAIEYGTNEVITHRPNVRGPRGEVIGYYAVAKLKGGGTSFDYMSVEEVHAIRDASGNVSAYSPWSKHPVEMGRKTIIKRLFKYLPVSLEYINGVSLEGRALRLGEGGQPEAADEEDRYFDVVDVVDEGPIEQSAKRLEVRRVEDTYQPDESSNSPEELGYTEGTQAQANKRAQAEEVELALEDIKPCEEGKYNGSAQWKALWSELSTLVREAVDASVVAKFKAALRSFYDVDHVVKITPVELDRLVSTLRGYSAEATDADTMSEREQAIEDTITRAMQQQSA